MIVFFDIVTPNSGTNLPVETSFIKSDFAITTFKNLPNNGSPKRPSK